MFDTNVAGSGEQSESSSEEMWSFELTPALISRPCYSPGLIDRYFSISHLLGLNRKGPSTALCSAQLTVSVILTPTGQNHCRLNWVSARGSPFNFYIEPDSPRVVYKALNKGHWLFLSWLLATKKKKTLSGERTRSCGRYSVCPLNCVLH